VRRWANRHPIEGALYRRPSIDSAVAELLASSGASGVFGVLGNLDETMADVMTRMDLYTMYLPRLARWEAELAADDLTRGVEPRTLSAEFERLTRAVDRLAAVAEPASDLAVRERAAVLDAVRGERTVVLDAVQKERIATLHEIEAIAQRLGDRSGPSLRDAVGTEMKELVKSVEEMRKRLIVEAGEALDRVVDHAFFRLVQLLLICAGLVAMGLLFRAFLLRRRGRERQPSDSGR
jgi:maltooligosyltrehalose synthase